MTLPNEYVYSLESVRMFLIDIFQGEKYPVSLKMRREARNRLKHFPTTFELAVNGEKIIKEAERIVKERRKEEKKMNSSVDIVDEKEK